MQLHDARFREDRFFLFDMFATQQKRDVSNSARLVIQRSSWDHLRESVNRITTDDIAKAVDEEEAGVQISNDAIRSFIREASTTRSHAVGSDSDRYANRQAIWGYCIIYGKPTIWLTINPADHHDPIAMVLVGEDIDLDNFCASLGPTATERSSFLVSNPFAATEYFHIVVTAVFEYLLGVKVTSHQVSSQPGVLGLITAYYAMIEAQGRSNLHTHSLHWLANTPDCVTLLERYKDENFLSNMNAYVRETIHAHVEGLSEQRGLAPAPIPHPSWARPPNPRSNNWSEIARHAELMHVEASQFHKCTPHPYGCARLPVNGKQSLYTINLLVLLSNFHKHSKMHQGFPLRYIFPYCDR